jgi:hypothetical protein
VLDLREASQLKDWWFSNARFWQDTPFRWTRWERRHEDWTHDHCTFCNACICDHRARFPEWKSAHKERGCYRHAYFAQKPDKTYQWVCRNCFKRVRDEFNWSAVTPRDERVKVGVA